MFGPDKCLQPLFVDDAALAMAAALADPARHGGKVYELGGPEVLTMLELNQRIAAAQGRKGAVRTPARRGVSGVCDGDRLAAFAPLSRDQWRMLAAGNVVPGEHPGIAELGIEPRPLGLFLDRWMVRYRKHGRFGATSADLTEATYRLHSFAIAAVSSDQGNGDIAASQRSTRSGKLGKRAS